MLGWAVPALMASPHSLRLPRSGRIRQRGDFARIRSEGRRLSLAHFILNWLLLPEGSASRLGVIVSRRVGSAVVRNRVRRLLRESFRHHRHLLTKPADLVLIAKPSLAGRKFVEVEEDFRAALHRASLLKGTT